MPDVDPVPSAAGDPDGLLRSVAGTRRVRVYDSGLNGDQPLTSDVRLDVTDTGEFAELESGRPI